MQPLVEGITGEGERICVDHIAAGKREKYNTGTAKTTVLSFYCTHVLVEYLLTKFPRANKV